MQFKYQTESGDCRDIKPMDSATINSDDRFEKYKDLERSEGVVRVSILNPVELFFPADSMVRMEICTDSQGNKFPVKAYVDVDGRVLVRVREMTTPPESM